MDKPPPTLLVLNKKDKIKPGEIAKKLEVRTLFVFSLFALVIWCFLRCYLLTYLNLNAYQWYEKLEHVDEVIPVSAKYGHGVDDVKNWILSKLPLGPAYYPKVINLQQFVGLVSWDNMEEYSCRVCMYSQDIVSEHPERFFVAEIIREKIFMQYRDEVPYACQVIKINIVSVSKVIIVSLAFFFSL